MFIAIDLETTGLNPKKDKIIEIAAIKIEMDGTILEEFHSLVHPNVPIPELITHLTGITDEELVGAPTIDTLKKQIQAFIGELPILGHSVQFDVDFLEASGITTHGTILDTFRLAQTLLPREQSYSLEILSEKYNLTHSNKHRADDDTRVAIELYKLLLQKISEIPSEVITQIKPLLEKSEWSWKTTFQKYLNETETPARSPETPVQPRAHNLQPSPETPVQPNPETHRSELQSIILEHLIAHKNALIEAPYYSAADIVTAAKKFTEQSGEKCVIGTRNPDLIPREEQVAHLDHPGGYLCQTELKHTLQKSSFSEDETRLLVKILLWNQYTKHGAKHEIEIGNDEQSAWNQISAYPHLFQNNCKDSECFYTKALKIAKSSPVLMVSPELILENIVERGKLIPVTPHLILGEIEQFEEATLNTFTRYFSHDSFEHYTKGLQDEKLENNFAMLFGLLGILSEKYAAPNAFANQLILTKDHTVTPEWDKVSGSLETIEHQLDSIEEASPMLKAKFNALKKALARNRNVLTWIMQRIDGTPVVRACPIEIGKLLKQELWDKNQTLLAISRFGTLEKSFGFLKGRLALDPEIEEISLGPEANVTLPKPILKLNPELPNPKSPKNLNATIEHIKKILTEDTKKDCALFLLMNSIKATEQMHEKLAGPLKERSINLLSQGMSGGIGKITQLFTQSPCPVLLIGTQKLYSAILKSKDASKITTLLIHRLPFLPPSHPIHQKQSANLNDGFAEYSLPQAILRLKYFLDQFLRHTNPETIHMLDPRFENYDRKFIKSLPVEILA